MSCDYKSDDPRLCIDPRLLEKREEEFLKRIHDLEIRNISEGLYIVQIKNGKSKVFKMPEEDKALKDILVMFKSFVDRISERR